VHFHDERSACNAEKYHTMHDGLIVINTGIDLTYLMVVWCVNRRLSVQSSSSL